jgi:hypothetical protein
MAPERCEVVYECVCGRQLTRQYGRFEEASDAAVCQCGSLFVVGPEAPAVLVVSLDDITAFRLQKNSFTSPWGDRIEAAIANPAT